MGLVSLASGFLPGFSSTSNQFLSTSTRCLSRGSISPLYAKKSPDKNKRKKTAIKKTSVVEQAPGGGLVDMKKTMRQRKEEEEDEKFDSDYLGFGASNVSTCFLFASFCAHSH